MVPGSYIGENSLESTISAIKSVFVGKARTFPTPWDISTKVAVESKLCALPNYVPLRGGKAT